MKRFAIAALLLALLAGVSACANNSTTDQHSKTRSTYGTGGSMNGAAGGGY